MKKLTKRSWDKYLSDDLYIKGLKNKDRNIQKKFFTITPHYCKTWVDGVNKNRNQP